MSDHLPGRKPGPGAYNSGCRCDECRRLNRERGVRIRATLAARPREDVPHGTYGGYTNWACRCDLCRDAHSVALRAFRRSARSPAG